DVSLLMDGPVCKCRGHTIYFYYPASGVYCSFLNGCLSPEKYDVFHSGVKLPFVFAMRLQNAFRSSGVEHLKSTVVLSSENDNLKDGTEFWKWINTR
ncbi:hypothetical protein JOQ06_028871, partial [Pogonophryne albipinna]